MVFRFFCSNWVLRLFHSYAMAAIAYRVAVGYGLLPLPFCGCESCVLVPSKEIRNAEPKICQ